MWLNYFDNFETLVGGKQASTPVAIVVTKIEPIRTTIDWIEPSFAWDSQRDSTINLMYSLVWKFAQKFGSRAPNDFRLERFVKCALEGFVIATLTAANKMQSFMCYRK